MDSQVSHHLLCAWILVVAFFSNPCTAIAARQVLPASTPAPTPQPTNRTKPTKPNATEQFLAAHNRARAAVHVPPLIWSAKLDAEASRLARYQRDNKGCELADMNSSPYGVNQAWASYPAGPLQVVGSWVEGKRYYDHSNNKCKAGHECGTYKQVVWRKTRELGCSQVTCSAAKEMTATLTICLYFPHGNVQGQSPY